jgi:hypothetical protein
MNEELLGCAVVFAISGFWLYSMHKKDQANGLDNMDIHRGRFKSKVILLMVAAATFFCLMVKLYQLCF